LVHTFLKSIDRRSLAELPSVTHMHAATIHPSQLIHHRRPYVLLLLLALGLFAPVIFAAPQPGAMPKGERHESRREIDQLEEAWRNAVLKADIATMNSLLAEDYMAITPMGRCRPRNRLWPICAAA